MVTISKEYTAKEYITFDVEDIPAVNTSDWYIKSVDYTGDLPEGISYSIDQTNKHRFYIDPFDNTDDMSFDVQVTIGFNDDIARADENYAFHFEGTCTSDAPYYPTSLNFTTDWGVPRYMTDPSHNGKVVYAEVAEECIADPSEYMIRCSFHWVYDVPSSSYNIYTDYDSSTGMHMWYITIHDWSYFSSEYLLILDWEIVKCYNLSVVASGSQPVYIANKTVVLRRTDSGITTEQLNTLNLLAETLDLGGVSATISDGGGDYVTKEKLSNVTQSMFVELGNHLDSSTTYDFDVFRYMKSIIGIPAQWAEGKKITVVSIPENVSYIGNRAFAPSLGNTGKLKKVNFIYDNFGGGVTNKLTSIGGEAFANNEISEVRTYVLGSWFSGFPSALTSIGMDAFYNNTYFLNIDLSHTKLTSVSIQVFERCGTPMSYSSDTFGSIRIPSTVKTISNYAFSGSRINNVYFYSTDGSIPTLGTDAFRSGPGTDWIGRNIGNDAQKTLHFPSACVKNASTINSWIGTVFTDDWTVSYDLD